MEALARVLYIDDDSNLLAGVRRQQRGRFEMRTEENPRVALEALAAGEKFSVIVSDLRMPGIDGFEVLRRAEQLMPEATRILLTGNADLETAKRAVNEGHVFRFLTKPCAPDELAAALRAAAELHDLRVAQRELLERTLRGAVQVLADVLGLVNPAAFGRASRVTRYVKAIVAKLALPDAWRYEVAAMLSQVGCVTVPPALVEKVDRGEELDAAERKMLMDHPRVAQQLLSGIPRLEEVAEMIRYQNDRCRSPDGAPAADVVEPKDLPMGSRILKIALDLDELETQEGSRPAALAKLLARRDHYDPDVLEIVEEALSAGIAEEIIEVEIAALVVGMTVAEDIRTVDGLLLVSAGQPVNVGMIQRLQNWARRSERSIAPLIRVSRPALG